MSNQNQLGNESPNTSGDEQPVGNRNSQIHKQKQIDIEEWTPFDATSSQTQPPDISAIKKCIEELKTERLSSHLHLPPTVPKATLAEARKFAKAMGLHTSISKQKKKKYQGQSGVSPLPHMVIRSKIVKAQALKKAFSEKPINVGLEEQRTTEWTPHDPASSQPPEFSQIKKWIQELTTQRLDSDLHLPSNITKDTKAEVKKFCRVMGLKNFTTKHKKEKFRKRGGGSPTPHLAIRSNATTSQQTLRAAAQMPVKFGSDELEMMAQISHKFSATDDDERQIRRVKTLKHVDLPDKQQRPSEQRSLRGVPPPASRVPGHVASAKQQLPITRHRRRILNALQAHDVLLVSGGTGTGKSTQVPQYVLEQAQAAGQSVRIVCTQPRRLSAVTVAERVAVERGELLGTTVGYHVRLEPMLGKDTVLTFCTPGVLLRTIKTKRLTDITHVFLDEVHERGMDTDYLLAVLKDIQSAGQVSPVKLVLMSATMQADLALFQSFFPNAVHIEVPGRMYDVDTYHLEDVLTMMRYRPSLSAPKATDRSKTAAEPCADDVELLDDNDEVIASAWPAEQPEVVLTDCLPDWFEPDTVNALMPIGSHAQAKERLNDYRWTRQAMQPTALDRIDLQLAVALAVYINNSTEPGAILVFLTGYDDINTMRRMLLDNEVTRRCANEWEMLMLHSEMDTRHQHQILSTNIAEASLTIDDVVFVIDCGRVKEKRYYPKTHISTLLPVSIAKSNAEQRRGRAGRCQRGYCFRLYSRDDYDLMPLAATPEIKRNAIHDICLHARQMADDRETIAGFLSKCPEPPDDDVIDHSVQHLKVLWALTESEQLTDVGRVLTALPLDLCLGRQLLWSIALQCLEPVLTIAALMSYRDPFLIAATTEQRAQVNANRAALTRADQSDHLQYVRLFHRYCQLVDDGDPSALYEFCEQMYVSVQTMHMCWQIRSQLLKVLCRLRLVSAESWPQLNAHSHSWPMIKACLTAGSHPYLAHVGDTAQLNKISTVHERRCRLVNSCALMQNSTAGTTAAHKKGKRPATSYDWQPPPSEVRRWLVYNELVQLGQNRVVLKHVTAVSPLAVCLLGGTCSLDGQPPQQMDDGRCVFVLTDSLQCAVDAESERLVHGLRVKLHALFLRRVAHRAHDADPDVVRDVHALLCAADRSCGFGDVDDLPDEHDWPLLTEPGSCDRAVYTNSRQTNNNRNRVSHNNVNQPATGSNKSSKAGRGGYRKGGSWRKQSQQQQHIVDSSEGEDDNYYFPRHVATETTTKSKAARGGRDKKRTRTKSSRSAQQLPAAAISSRYTRRTRANTVCRDQQLAQSSDLDSLCSDDSDLKCPDDVPVACARDQRFQKKDRQCKHLFHKRSHSIVYL